MTDHFYAFTGTPGDVSISVKSNNLNGDVDLFTAGSLRPLMKFSLYAESSSPVTRAIYLRKREALILRVQARSPNDDEGIYHIKLGGSFEPIAGDVPLADAHSPTSESASTVASQGTRRVSSVGARIAEPPPAKEEVAAAPSPQPTPEDLAVPTATPEPPVETAAAAPAPTPRRARGSAPGRRRPASQPTKEDVPAVADTANEEKVSEVSKSEDNPAPVDRRAGSRDTINRSAEDAPAPKPQIGPRLVIEMQDGRRIERFMSTIRRVTVENNQIVVVGKDGRIERTRMAEVIRMSIEP